MLRLLEGDEPQALWPLPSLLELRAAAKSDLDSTRERRVSLRIGVDLGSTSCAVVEEDDARAPLGGKLLAPDSAPSGFLLLAGDAASAHRYGCGESLRVRDGQLAAALCASSPEALASVLRGEGFAEQLWLPQAGGGETALEADRFKSPELLQHAEWLAALEEGGAPLAIEEVSRKLLHAYARLLGRALACAHATPISAAEGGLFHLRAPRLDMAELVLTHPRGAWSARSPGSFREVLEGAAEELCQGLRCAWSQASHRPICEPSAVRAARAANSADRHPIELGADFGGLTLQIAVRAPAPPGRPRPLIAGSSSCFLLGGEPCLSAAAFAAAGLDEPLRKADADERVELRAAYRAHAKRMRAWTGSGLCQEPASRQQSLALRAAIFETIVPLLRRQLVATLRRAAPDFAGLRGAGVHLVLLGDGWKLLALDAPEAQREAAMLERIQEHLTSEPLLPGADLLFERIGKPRLCEGALRVAADEPGPERLPELQGIDTQSGQRFFGLAEDAAGPRHAPSTADPWWQEFSKGAAENLLRVEQWFGRGSPFASRLADGHRSFAPGQSLLRQWLDLSGPSLVALRIFDRLRTQPSSERGSTAPPPIKTKR